MWNDWNYAATECQLFYITSEFTSIGNLSVYDATLIESWQMNNEN